MIDADAVDATLAQQLERKRMRPLEHLRVLHAERGQLVDVEEPPVVDLFRGDAPVGQAIRLRRQQIVEPIEAARMVPLAVERLHRPLDVRQHRGRVGRQPRETALDHFLLAVALGARLRRLRLASRQVPDGREDAQELETVVALADLREQRVGVDLEDAVVGARRDRQHAAEVVRVERAVDVVQRDLLPLERRAVRVSENRQQHLVLELHLERMPVDVEKRRVLGAGAVLEHVLPPGIGRLRDAHVIGHQVDDVAHVMAAQRPHPAVVALAIAYLRIELRRIGDVVPVCAARHRPEVARCIAVRDAKAVEVVDDGGRIVEGERRVELEPVRGGRDDRWRHCRGLVNQTRCHAVRRLLTR